MCSVYGQIPRTQHQRLSINAAGGQTTYPLVNKNGGWWVSINQGNSHKNNCREDRKDTILKQLLSRVGFLINGFLLWSHHKAEMEETGWGIQLSSTQNFKDAVYFINVYSVMEEGTVGSDSCCEWQVVGLGHIKGIIKNKYFGQF